VETAWKYVAAWQTVTGSEFVPRALGGAEEASLVMKKLHELRPGHSVPGT